MKDTNLKIPQVIHIEYDGNKNKKISVISKASFDVMFATVLYLIKIISDKSGFSEDIILEQIIRNLNKSLDIQHYKLNEDFSEGL